MDQSDIVVSFSINLAKAMNEAGVSIRELSARSGVSVRTISRYLNAEIEPGIGKLDILADALGTSKFRLLIPINAD